MFSGPGMLMLSGLMVFSPPPCSLVGEFKSESKSESSINDSKKRRMLVLGKRIEHLQ